jgi:hypothetical protein
VIFSDLFSLEGGLARLRRILTERGVAAAEPAAARDPGPSRGGLRPRRSGSESGPGTEDFAGFSSGTRFFAMAVSHLRFDRSPFRAVRAKLPSAFRAFWLYF